MGNGYTVPAVDSMDQIRITLRKILERLNELEALDGSQIYNTVQTLRQLVEGILEQTEVNVSGGVTAGGSGYFGGNLNVVGLITSLVTVENLLTANYRSLYGSTSEGPGNFGYVPSSRRFKTSIESAALPNIRDIMRTLRAVTFRYIAEVALHGDEAGIEWDFIAEEVHDLGLTWLIDYDKDGRPFGIKREKFVVLLVMAYQDQQSQIDALKERLDVAGI